MDARLNVNTSSSVLGPASTPAAETQGEGFGAALASASQQQSGDSTASSQAPVAAESSAAASGAQSSLPTEESDAKPAAEATEAKTGDAKPQTTDDTDTGKVATEADGEVAAKSGKDFLNAANLLQPGRQQPASAEAGEVSPDVDGDEPLVAKDAGDDERHDNVLQQPAPTKPDQSASTENNSDDVVAQTEARDSGAAIDLQQGAGIEATGSVPAAATQPAETSSQGASEATPVAAAATESADNAAEAEADAPFNSGSRTELASNRTGQGAGVTGEPVANPSPFAGLAQANPEAQPASAQDGESGNEAQAQTVLSNAKTGEPQTVAAAAQPLMGRTTQATKTPAGASAQAVADSEVVVGAQVKGDGAAVSSGGDSLANGDKANGELLAQLQGLKQAQDKLTPGPKGNKAALLSATDASSSSSGSASSKVASTDSDVDPLAKWVNEIVKTEGGAASGRTSATLSADTAVPAPETILASSAAAVEAAEAAELDLDPQLRLHQARTPEARVQAHQMQQQDPAAALRQPVAAERMAPELRERMMMMINSRTSQAEIRLDPPELGALQVKIQMNGDQAQVQMHAAQAQTREMVEQALPRLREMLAQQGITLADTHISHGSGGQAGNQTGEGQDQNGQPGVGDGMVEASDDTLAAVQQMTGRNADGGIDYYA